MRKPFFNRRIYTEGGLISLLSFLAYDGLGLATDDIPLLENITTHGGYLLIDAAYCMIFAFLVVISNALIARIKWFGLLIYSRQLCLSMLTLVVNLLIAGGMDWGYDYTFDVPYDVVSGALPIVAFLATASALAHNVQYYSHLIALQHNEAMTYQRQLLKAQLDPHFVFNNLNILSALVHLDADAADDFIVRLSRFYRHIIASIDSDTTPIADAVDMARNYAELMQVRFPDRLSLQIGDGLEADNANRILSSSLHLLMENAVKHNQPDGSGELRISIRRQGNYLAVRNNIIKSDGRKRLPSLGIGLTNLKQRYSLLCGKPPTIVSTPTYYEVLLPILPPAK